ncbi:MAG: hypothetical protein HOY71_01725 [Nonomuraea sp.]|nr:hypothetical protein [Nonomuraea sp.]
MIRRMLPASAAGALAAALLIGGSAPAAHADAAATHTKAEKISFAKNLTQNSLGSARDWLWARKYKDSKGIKDYGFNWNTNYCSNSPDTVAGVSFKNACARHDFGYRNFKALVGVSKLISDHKTRIDKAFYADMLIACTSASTTKKKISCQNTALTYYQIVKRYIPS